MQGRGRLYEGDVGLLLGAKAARVVDEREGVAGFACINNQLLPLRPVPLCACIAASVKRSPFPHKLVESQKTLGML